MVARSGGAQGATTLTGTATGDVSTAIVPVRGELTGTPWTLTLTGLAYTLDETSTPSTLPAVTGTPRAPTVTGVPHAPFLTGAAT